MSQSIAEILLRGAELGIRLEAGPDAGPPLGEIVVVGDLSAVAAVAIGSFVIVVPSARPPQAYQVDIALRQCSLRHVSGLVLDESSAITLTAHELAGRLGIPLLLSGSSLNGLSLALEIDRIIRGGAADAIARADKAIARANEIADENSVDRQSRILESTTAALGVNVRITVGVDPETPRSHIIYSSDQAVARLESESNDDAARIAIPAIAAVLSRVQREDLAHQFAPTLTRSELIVQLVLAERERSESFAEDALRLGLPLQYAHVGAWLRVSETHDLGELARRRQLIASIELSALQLVSALPELWHVAVVRGDFILTCSEPNETPDMQRRMGTVAGSIIEMAERFGEFTLTAGLGTPQFGASGMRQSLFEARIAADSAAARGNYSTVNATDVTGLRRVLIDFYASPTSRMLLTDILAPLDKLGEEKSLTAVTTLLSYIGHRNSLSRAAAQLHLHPNAVGYRMKSIASTLGLDLDDPDQRFAVELACRVRLLGPPRSGLN